MKILVTGASGLLGPYVVEAAGRLGTVVTTARCTGDIECDLTRPDEVRRLILGVEPDVVIHLAAATDVDACERNSEWAMALNARATALLAANMNANVRIVNVSTDQVYPDTSGPHDETSPAPVNVYGRTKLEGEAPIVARPNGLVVRTNLFGPSCVPGRRSFSDFIVQNLREGNDVTFFEDVFFSPLHVESLASMIVEAVECGLSGVYNLGSREGMSKKDFAFALAKHLKLDTASARIGRSSAVKGRAPRTHDLRLDVSRAEKAFGRTQPTLLDEIRKLVPVPGLDKVTP